MLLRQVSDGIVAYDRGLHDLVDAVDSLPRLSSYLIVLGIADYVDGTKGRSWQPYASLAAAAFTKTTVNALSSTSKRPFYR